MLKRGNSMITNRKLLFFNYVALKTILLIC